jgi:hypothetical protein
MGDSPSLMDQVVAASGLSPVFARSAIERACNRVSVSPARLTPETLRLALESIERGLRVFLKSPDLEQRLAAIARLAR